MCAWQHCAVSCPSISVLIRMIVFPELCERKKVFNIFHIVMAWFIVYYIKLTLYRNIFTTIYNMPGHVSIYCLTQNCPEKSGEVYSILISLWTTWLSAPFNLQVGNRWLHGATNHCAQPCPILYTHYHISNGNKWQWWWRFFVISFPQSCSLPKCSVGLTRLPLLHCFCVREAL